MKKKRNAQKNKNIINPNSDNKYLKQSADYETDKLSL